MLLQSVTSRSALGASGLSQSAQGTNPSIASGQFSDVLVSELLPRYGTLTKAGLVYGVSYASGATAAASATATGPFCLFNPSNSGKELHILDIVAVLNAFAAAATGLVAGLQIVSGQTPTIVTAGTTPSALYAGGSAGASVAKTYTAGTLVGASTNVQRIVAAWYFDLAASDIQTLIKDQIDGEIVIAPGSMLNIVSVANTPTILASLTWAEIPV